MRSALRAAAVASSSDRAPKVFLRSGRFGGAAPPAGSILRSSLPSHGLPASLPVQAQSLSWPRLSWDQRF